MARTSISVPYIVYFCYGCEGPPVCAVQYVLYVGVWEGASALISSWCTKVERLRWIRVCKCTGGCIYCLLVYSLSSRNHWDSRQICVLFPIAWMINQTMSPMLHWPLCVSMGGGGEREGDRWKGDMKRERTMVALLLSYPGHSQFISTCCTCGAFF